VTPVNEHSPDRALEIDGIRGWASLSVVLFHMFHEMFVRLLPGLDSRWLALFFNGRLAVCIFFVLSGDALSTTFFARGGRNPVPVDRLLVRRYTRLTIPILMSCTLVFLLRAVHADWHAPATAVIHRPEWLGELIAFDFSTVGLLRYSLLGVYVSHSKATSYNPFLWTMSIEMLGSMLVFLMCYLWPRLRSGRTLLGLCALVLFALDSFLSLFFAGMFFGLLRNQSFFRARVTDRRWQGGVLVAFAGLLVLLVATNDLPLPLFFDLAVAVALVFVFYSHRGLKRFLQGRLSTWLGEISFPLYLVQFAVIISLESWLTVRWSALHAAPEWLLAIGACAVATAIAAAWIFRQVERIILKRADGIVLQALDRN
jgi:peptidoglycan/LPS O-acetylase OafA/YrhL